MKKTKRLRLVISLFIHYNHSDFKKRPSEETDFIQAERNVSLSVSAEHPAGKHRVPWLLSKLVLFCNFLVFVLTHWAMTLQKCDLSSVSNGPGATLIMMYQEQQQYGNIRLCIVVLWNSIMVKDQFLSLNAYKVLNGKTVWWAGEPLRWEGRQFLSLCCLWGLEAHLQWYWQLSSAM